ncbi:hypothetical protein [Pseudodesulfovibrio sp.]|uniref:hypothetical protein n=1 Tax=Pseudodesulfovibrio sp. TaxID=2035812 RepID=UPI00260F1804|nr:hypothetical protein [Pseudodesulfovibrio sp.]MDD3310956.1 hypothetical protein [Pseudodesulfovibrio sp.]
MKSGVTVLKDKAFNLGKALRDLTMQSVLVGIPGSAGPHDDSDLTNAEIGYIHEMGSPRRNIPARPFLESGIRAAQKQIVEQLRNAGTAALEGSSTGVKHSLEKAGLVAQNSVRAHFVDNDWEPLAESTLNRHPVTARDDEGKPTKHGKSRQERGAINPLIDSSQLRKAVTYLVRKGR